MPKWLFQNTSRDQQGVRFSIGAQRKLLNFENWVNGEVSKIGHHLRKQSDLKIDVIKSNRFTSISLLSLKVLLNFDTPI